MILEIALFIFVIVLITCIILAITSFNNDEAVTLGVISFCLAVVLSSYLLGKSHGVDTKFEQEIPALIKRP